jgi:hypothetical protein
MVNTHLILCRTARDITYVEEYYQRSQANLVVVSDDIEVQEVCSKLPFIKAVSWIEQAESLFMVSDDVILVTKAINEWLSLKIDVAGGIPKQLVFWLQQVEGGMAAQRIQDAMLLIRSYDCLIHTYNPSCVILISNPDTLWEDSVLLQTCANRDLIVEVIGKYKASVLLARIRNFLRNTLVREPLYIFDILREKIRGIRVGVTKENREVVFQLCSSGKNHIQNILPIMAELQKRNYDPVALCWMASGGADEVKKANISAVQLENYVPIKGLWQGGLRAYRTWVAINPHRVSFLEHPALVYKGVSIGPLLWPSIKYHVFVDLPQRYRLNLALREYLSGHSPLAIKLWGGGELAESRILLQHIQASSKPEPLLMFWFWGFFEDPYVLPPHYINLYLAAGRHQEDYLSNRGISKSKIASVGMSQYDWLARFSAEHSAEQSRYILGIPEGFVFYVLYDMNLPYRGYLSPSEQTQLREFLLKFSRNHKEVALIIKPHPGYDSKIMKQLIQSCSSSNVFFVERNALTGHSLNSADLLITKNSTIGLEAMLMECPVVSVMLDEEKEFQTFGEAAEYIATIHDLSLLLGKLTCDPVFRKQWADNRIKKGRHYATEYVGQRKVPSASLAAAAIDSCIRGVRATEDDTNSCSDASCCSSWKRIDSTSTLG